MTHHNQVPRRITRSSSAAAKANDKSNAMKMKRKSFLDDLLHDDMGRYEKKNKKKNCDDEDEYESSDWFCNICFEFKPKKTDMFQGEQCSNHSFCNDCISKYVASKLHQNVLIVNCPYPNCHVQLESKYLQPILPKEFIDRWESAKCEYDNIIASSLRFHCPFEDCSVPLLVNVRYNDDDDDDGEIVISILCNSCERLVCMQCKVPWHSNMSCKEFERSKCEEDMDRKFLELAKSEKWQKCPKCSIIVQKHSGCNHIFCRCGCRFCYNCGKCGKDVMVGNHECARMDFTSSLLKTP